MGSHRYSRNPDHIRRRNVPAPSNPAIASHLEQLLSPAVYAQQAYYRSLGLRDRILTLPLMVAAIVTLIMAASPVGAGTDEDAEPSRFTVGKSGKGPTTVAE